MKKTGFYINNVNVMNHNMRFIMFWQPLLKLNLITFFGNFGCYFKIYIIMEIVVTQLPKNVI